MTVNAGDELVAPPEVPDTTEVTDPATEGETMFMSGADCQDGDSDAVIITCQVTPPAASVARAAADHASKVAVRVTRGGKMLASGSGALRKDVVSAKLRTKHWLGRGSYVVTVSLPSGARSAKTSVK